jgi:hypothetical protein
MIRKIKPMQGKKAAAWKAFSIYIRTRDCIKTTGDIEYGKCYTCGKIFPFSELDAGHGIGSRRNSILFDDSIVKVSPKLNTTYCQTKVVVYNSNPYGICS